MTEPKELAIGEIAEIDGVRVRCVEHVSGGEFDCKLCAFQRPRICPKSSQCIGADRSDGREVHFEEVVGV